MSGIIEAIFIVIIVFGVQKLGIKTFITFKKGQGVMNTIISLFNLGILCYIVFMLSSGSEIL